MARILLIEDNPTNLELMVYLLEAFGHQTIQAELGESGVAAALANLPELILCDLQLPDIDGYQVAAQLKSDLSTRSIPLIAVTAFAMVGDRDKVLAAGFDGYISKPIAPDTFIPQVESYLLFTHEAMQPQVYLTTGQAEPQPQNGISVLVVDDLLINLELLQSLLTLSGYAVRIAHGVSEAQQMLQQWKPDLVLTDLRMPGQTGYELLKSVREDPDMTGVRVIIHSASYTSQKDIDEAYSLGADHFITRPVEPEKLLREVEACMARK
jgi:CheY-like chemotaxis protein